jgi:hypothetical protein
MSAGLEVDSALGSHRSFWDFTFTTPPLYSVQRIDDAAVPAIPLLPNPLP